MITARFHSTRDMGTTHRWVDFIPSAGKRRVGHRLEQGQIRLLWDDHLHNFF